MSDESTRYRINDWVIIRNGEAHKNGVLEHQLEASSADDFLSALYKALRMDYPKWFKMDRLSKLGMLATEILLGKPTGVVEQAYNWGIVLANQHGSLDTDRRFAEQINDLPSPAVFVYTLPNILTGELSIRYGFKGEQAFFVANQFSPDLLVNYVSALLDEGSIQDCLVGWVDILGESYEAVLYKVSAVGSESVHSLPFSENNLSKLYHE